ncbi:MAG TPA: zinc ribbon domain-containing protein [Terracidiphilus sp.]
MASFCPNCGAAVSPGVPSCSSCGTAIAAAAAPPAFTPVQPAAAPAFAPVQTAAAPAKSNTALKVVLIIICVFVGLGVLVFGTLGYFAYRVAHSVKLSSNGDKVSINVPGGGTFSANTSEKFTAADLGVDIYPGATAGKAGARMSTNAGSWITAVYVTPDSQDKVLSFYKDKLGSDASFMESSGGDVITLKKGEQEAVVVTITSNSSQYDGKTQIAIMHTKSTKAS